MLDEEMLEEMQQIMAHARQCLSSAYLLFSGNDYPGAINRAYYCVFHCTRALLLNDDSAEFKKHSAVISYFRKKYIKTEILEKRLSDIIGNLSDDRNTSDYTDCFLINTETTEARIKDAEYFLQKTYEYLNNNFIHNKSLD